MISTFSMQGSNYAFNDGHVTITCVFTLSQVGKVVPVALATAIGEADALTSLGIETITHTNSSTRPSCQFL